MSQFPEVWSTGQAIEEDREKCQPARSAFTPSIATAQRPG
jgi:hypothetical protein